MADSFNNSISINNLVVDVKNLFGENECDFYFQTWLLHSLQTCN